MQLPVHMPVLPHRGHDILLLRARALRRSALFRAALVRPFSDAFFKEPAEPLGIEALAAVLRRNGIEFALFDRELDSFDETARAILEYKPSLLGFSVLLEDNAADAIRLLLRIREVYDVPCVIGGMFVTTCCERARALFPGDCELVAGEGETAILRACSRLTGIEYADMEKPFLQPGEWPWLYRHRLQEYLDIGAPINMRASRGCPGKCRFCTTPSLPGGLGRWRGRPVSDVADEIGALCREYTPHAFNFVDDDFGPLRRLEKLVDELAARKLRCALSLQLRMDALCRERDLPALMRKLREGGLGRVFVGLESVDRAALEYFGKDVDPERALEALGALREAGVAAHIGYILWHPLSTPDSVRAEAKILKDAGLFTTKIVMARLLFFQGSALWRERRAKPGAGMPIDPYYEAVRDKAAPLYGAWLKGALDIPLRYSLAAIARGGDEYAKARAVEKQLSRLDEMAYRTLIDPDGADEPAIRALAADVEERLNEIGSPHNGPRRGAAT